MESPLTSLPPEALAEVSLGFRDRAQTGTRFGRPAKAARRLTAAGISGWFRRPPRRCGVGSSADPCEVARRFHQLPDQLGLWLAVLLAGHPCGSSAVVG